MGEGGGPLALALKREDMSSNPKHPCKKSGAVACSSINPALWRTETAGFLGLARNIPYSLRDPVSKE